MKKLRVGVIGTGYFSHYHYDAWSRIDEVELVAIAYSSNRDRAEAVAARYGIGRVFDDPARMMDEVAPDLVDIISTPESHLGLIAETCARTIPTVTQKPLAPSLPDSEAIARLARESGTLVVVHENWRFKPWFREMAELTQQGRIGEPICASFTMRPGDGRGPDAYLARQPYFQKMPRFLVQETGVHVIDVFRHILGDVDGVTARLRRLNPVIAGEDAGVAIFDFRSGAIGLLDANRHLDHPTDDIFRTMGHMTVEGSEGSLALDGFGRIRFRPFGGPDVVEHRYDWLDAGYAGDCVFALQRHVIDHLLRKTPIENDVASYMPNLWTVEAAYISAREGRHVSVDEVRNLSRPSI